MYTLYYITSKGFPVSHAFETKYELIIALHALVMRFKRVGLSCQYSYNKDKRRAVVVNK